MELGNATAELVLAVRIRPDDLNLAHRQRGAPCTHGAEAAAARLGLLEEVEIDLDVVDLLHAPDVRVPPRLVGVDERTRHPQARTGVDDLLAVDVAVAARHLVLDPERELDPCWSFLHDPIVFTVRHPPQDLTNSRFSGSGDTRADPDGRARPVCSLLRPWYAEFSSVFSGSRRSRSRCTTWCTRRRRSSSCSRRSRSSRSPG